VLTGGLGGMGGAQPLAATMHDGVCLAVEVDPARVQRRLDTRYVDRSTNSLDEGLRWCEEAKVQRRALSVGLVGNCAEVLAELARRGHVPDVVTDQTSAHDPLNGYIPAGLTLAAATALRRDAPEEYLRRSVASIVTHVQAMLALKRRGAVTFDYGNNIRTEARDAGVADAFEIPGFVPEYIRPLFCEGKGPFRWVALSGDPRDVERTDRLVLELFPEQRHLRRWIELARERVAFQGLPARICWLGQGERARFGCALNDLVKRGDIAAPVVIGRDHLDTGSVASPFRETEAMRDGSDAIADWPILNALLNTSSGATWVAVHHGGGVGIGRSIHAGAQVCVEGTALSARRAELLLTNDPATGVMRHADAGVAAAHARIEAACAEAAATGGVVVVIGGDNSLTFPALRGSAAGALDDGWGLITFDAHHDVRDAALHGGPRNGTPVRDLILAGLPGRRVAQIGVHG